MNEETESRLTKIDALLRQAEATNFPEEAKAFTAKAEELMAKWNIDAAAARAARPVQDRFAEIDGLEVVVWYSPTQGPKTSLLHNLARANSCDSFYINAKRWDEVRSKYRNCQVITVIGMPEARESIERLYASCLVQAEREFLSDEVQQAKNEDIGEGLARGGKSIRFQNSFMFGYATAIAKRVRETRIATEQAAEVATPGTALVLASDRSLVQRYMAERFPDLYKGSRSHAQINHRAAGLGVDAGNRADLGQSKVSNRKEELE